ncbi:hypothetical protein [Massilia sp. NR 4-1]|uniref:hypothetical protein n=1 Tax=Massilia sp. NR 4-1 TaxID=1678028 RepID=UPI00067C0252|nr:hypothetical protein [Massilia sp. NR 4-1]AKU24207.1 hypothetical protein ACZ75_24880 [Massilia sp. NR 4-1]
MSIAANVIRAALGAVLVLGTGSAMAQMSRNVTASDKISIGTMSIIAAPVASVAGSADGSEGASVGVAAVGVGSAYVVSGIAQGVGDTVEILLSAVGSAGKLSIKVTGKTLGAIGVSVGTSVQVLSETTGTVLVASGKVLAFIPNEIGQALLNQSRLPAN